MSSLNRPPLQENNTINPAKTNEENTQNLSIFTSSFSTNASLPKAVIFSNHVETLGSSIILVMRVCVYVDTRDNDIFRNFSPRTASYDLFPFSSPKSNFFVSSSSPRYHPSPLSVVYIYIMPSGMYSSVGDGGWKPSMSVCLACVSLDRACDGLGGKDILSLSLCCPTAKWATYT